MFELWRGQGLTGKFLFAGWTLSVLGPVMLIFGGIGIAHEWKFLSVATRTQATVVEMVDHHGDSGTSYAPVYVFRDVAGQEQKVSSRCSSYPPSYQVGDRINVLYVPGFSRDSQIESFFEMWGWKAIIGGIGLVHSLIGIVLLFVSRKRKDNADDKPAESRR